MKSYLSELFSSIQGEGPYVGERQLFMRFCGCHRECVYCDTNTQRTEAVVVERVPGSGVFESIPNPLSVDDLMEWVRILDHKKNNRHISLTGGAPLLQAKFLGELLPRLENEGHRNYLETAGDLPRQLEAIVEYLDVVAMDVKLSSVTHEKNTFPAHWQFLSCLRAYNVDSFVKLIVSDETDEAELMEAVNGIHKSGGKDTIVILQALSPTERVSNVPSVQQLMRWQEKIGDVLPHVRVIPQTHKMMGML
jgi:organic radical activating enzyme